MSGEKYKLVIDAGNTNLHFGLFSASTGRLLHHIRLCTRKDKTYDEYYLNFMSFMSIHEVSCDNIVSVIVGCVSGRVIEEMLTTLIEELICRPCHFVSAGGDYGFSVPAQAGADRIANAVAVRQRKSVPAVVVDMGTASSFDIIGQNGDLSGVVIAMGLDLFVHGHNSISRNLHYTTFSKHDAILGQCGTDNQWGTDTKVSMSIGLHIGYMGMIKQILEYIKTGLHAPAKVYLTGGRAHALPSWMVHNIADEWVVNMTLEGLLEAGVIAGY